MCELNKSYFEYIAMENTTGLSLEGIRKQTLIIHIRI